MPATNGQRIALREYLVFDQETRDELLSQDLDRVADSARDIVLRKEQSMLHDAQKRLDEGLISQRTFDIIKKGFD